MSQRSRRRLPSAARAGGDDALVGLGKGSRGPGRQLGSRSAANTSAWTGPSCRARTSVLTRIGGCRAHADRRQGGGEHVVHGTVVPDGGPGHIEQDSANGPITSVGPRCRQCVRGDGRRTRHAPSAGAGHRPHGGEYFFSCADVAVDALGVDALPPPRHRRQGCSQNGFGAAQQLQAGLLRTGQSRRARRRRACPRWSAPRRVAAPGGVGGDGRRRPHPAAPRASNGTTS